MEKLKWVPKRYQERIENLEKGEDLIDNCKYMLYFNENWCWDEDYCSIPVKSKKEALEFIKEARLRTEEEKEKHR